MDWPVLPALRRAVDGVTDAIPPVETKYGWHVIQLEDTRSPTVPAYEDVKPQVEQLTQRKKVQAYLDQLRKNAKIQITE